MKKLLLVGSLLVLLAACDRPECKNSNPIFDQYTYETFEYKHELVKEMSRIGPENISYRFDAYLEEEEQGYILVNMQLKNLCTKALIRVDDWSAMSGIKKNKGVSYRGAQLKGLAFNIIKSDKKIDFVFSHIDNVVD